jgi:2-keto-4-pentenoate hydratase/2-oxohepta-3-ene-1,7-dioic acid hydratase in catechol pathway
MSAAIGSDDQNFDQWAPMGPCITSTKIVPDPAKLKMRLSVNGDVRQETPISDLLFDVCLSFASLLYSG